MINKCAKNILRIICIFIISIIITSFFPGNLMTVSAKKATERIIVAMGDSYSSGEGIETFFGWDKESIEKTVKNDDWLAHRSEKAWSGMLTLPSSDETPIKMEKYDTKTKKGNWYFVASSGATTGDINYSQAKEYSRDGLKSDKDNPPALEPQIRVFDELKNNGKEPDYVTLTLGGNDAGFADVVTKAAISNPYLHLNLFYASITSSIKKIPNIKNDLYNVYHDIKDASKHADGTQADIIVAGYPELLGNLWTPISSSTFFTHDEVLIMNAAVRYFNSEIEAVVKDCQKENMKIHFVSVEESFKGHGAYANPLQLTSVDENIDENNEKNLTEGEYINRVVLLAKDQDLKDSPPSAYSMHPNLRGANAYARCVQTKIDEIEREKGNNDEPLVVELDDNQSSDFKSGKYLVNIGNKIIAAKSDGIFYKENVTSKAKKISNTGNVISLLSDGETVYYVEGYDDYTDIDKRFTSKKIYKTSINDSKSEYIFSSNGQADFITCQNGCLYYLDITKSGNDYKYSLMKHKIGSSDSTKLVGEWSADLPAYWEDTAYCLGNTIFLTVNNSLCSYSIGNDKYSELISASDGSICGIIDNKVCFRYSKGDNYYIAMIDANSNVETSVPISKKYDYQIVAQSGEYALFSSTMGSGEYNLYTIDLKTGKIDVSEGDAGGFLGKNYFVAHDLVKPENIYFMYGVRLYDENSKSLKQMKFDEFEINITKPMWIIDGYIVDWDMNTYKIYDDTVDSSNTNKTNLSQDESWKTLYIDHINSMNEVYEDIYIAYIDDDGIPELYVRGKYHMAGAALCWIDDGEVKFQACAQNFGFKEKSGKCYAYTMQMGVSLLTEYTLSDGVLTEKKIASCSENNDTYTWDGSAVSKDDFWSKHQSYINNYTTPNYTEYTSREDFATTIESY